MAGQIVAKVIDEVTGYENFYGVNGIRIKSKDYVLLIMQDYNNTLGYIDGDFYILTNDGEVAYKGIKGFYKHQRNQFVIVITTRTNNDDEYID